MNLSKPSLARLGGMAGILGVLMIGSSFSINTGPPPNADYNELLLFAAQHQSSVLWGAWLQAVGPLLIVFFAITLIHLAGAANRISGWMTLLGSGILMMVSLAEIIFYISALFPKPQTMGFISMDIAHSIQHLYFFVAAPSLFLPLGWALLSSRVLGKAYAYLALLLGLLFFITGILSLKDLVLSNLVTSLAAIQAFWWLAAGISLLVRAKKFKEG